MKFFDLTFKFECLGFVATCGQNIIVYLAILPTLFCLCFWSPASWDLAIYIFVALIYYNSIQPRNLSSGFFSWKNGSNLLFSKTVESYSMSVVNFTFVLSSIAYFVSEDQVAKFCLEEHDPLSCIVLIILQPVRFLGVAYTYYSFFVFSALLLFQSASYRHSNITVTPKPCMVCKNVFEEVAVSLHSPGNDDQYVCKDCHFDLTKPQDS